MSTFTADGQFLRAVLAALILATVISGAGLIFALVAVPGPPAAMTIAP